MKRIEEAIALFLYKDPEDGGNATIGMPAAVKTIEKETHLFKLKFSLHNIKTDIEVKRLHNRFSA